MRMEPLEYFKKSRLIGWIEAGAVITNHEGAVVFGAEAKGDARTFRFAGEFPGIIKEALQQSGDQSFVAMGLQTRGDGHLNFSIRLG